MTHRRFNFTKSISPGLVYGGVLLVLSICNFASAWTLTSDSTAVVYQPSHNLQPLGSRAVNAPSSQQPVLDEKRLFALGMIETGNNDGEVGKAGEVSRYQIHPVVWKSYSQKTDYRNPDVAVQVARQHWTWLAGYFKEKAGRPPTDFDMYVLWNTRFGYYAHKGFSRAKLASIVQDRAERFVNLVNRKG